MSSKPVGKKRPRIPKVRTGCPISYLKSGLNVHIRRVKCDESRPECKRCLTFGAGYCDGYEYGLLPKEQPEKKRLLFKEECQALVRRPAPQIDPSLEVFENQLEYHCFRFYMEDAAPSLSFSNQSIWHHLLLQATQGQPFIRHAITTIGALCRSSKNLGRKNVWATSTHRLPQHFRGCAASSASRQSRAFALQQYDKFLAGAKRQISTNPDMADVYKRRTALIVCLLVVCIETLQFQYTVALRHAHDGLRLMQEYLDTVPGTGGYGTSSLSSHVIEDELVQQFKRLDLQTLSWFGARTPVDHTRFKCEGSLLLRSMPKEFANIEEARSYLDIVMRRTYHFMAYALKGKVSFLAFHDTVLGDSDLDIKECWKNNPRANVSGSILDPVDGIHIEQEKHAAEIRRWSQAFQPLFHSALQNRDESQLLETFLLKIHSTSLTVRLAGILSSSELVYDGFKPEFKEIVSLSQAVLGHPNSEKLFAAGSFSFDIGIIYPLLAVSYACRDRTLRREAISLLESKSWREAQWGSSPSMHVSKFLMAVEEDGIETDFIPEWARARLSSIEVNTETGQARVCCIRGTGESAVSKYSVWH
ncbi:Aspercryptin biosynthesis cluster-specific transcription regulator atnN [Hyphodiscus hymeniophilus]|uniref:Aspercryptin biosynthesis cluster-specific transcription regulator atnN n=1 Tax=Hyphodiscus hymeniophilus TaxID=353542 RepID=A0A9P7AZL9_9HELO|nr:Aspercryptin biosynthesis cluster-specific transcription regulator atnN [Hyphodiscus hymeniophilus]